VRDHRARRLVSVFVVTGRSADQTTLLYQQHEPISLSIPGFHGFPTFFLLLFNATAICLIQIGRRRFPRHARVRQHHRRAQKVSSFARRERRRVAMRSQRLSARIAMVGCDVPQASRFTFHRCRAAKGSRKLTLAPACDQAGAFSCGPRKASRLGLQSGTKRANLTHGSSAFSHPLALSFRLSGEPRVIANRPGLFSFEAPGRHALAAIVCPRRQRKMPALSAGFYLLTLLRWNPTSP
jgi:hypothetical protein